MTSSVSGSRRRVSARRAALALCAWGLLYAAYRAYYALGGTAGMFGVPRSPSQFRTVNGIATGLLLLAAVLPLLLARGVRLRGAATVVGWIAGVGCCMHALVDSILRVLSLTGVHPTRLPPDLWLSYDRHASDLQDLLGNEPWFFVEGLLWAALALTMVRPARRRTWIASAVVATLLLTTIGVLSGVGAIGSFIVA